MFIQPSEEHPLPWRYVPLPFDGGGVNRFTYLIIAANDVEICCLCDQRTARFICAAASRSSRKRDLEHPDQPVAQRANVHI